MNFKPVDECYEDGLHILLMKDGIVKWSNRENARFTVPNEDGIAYSDSSIVYAALVEIERPKEVVYDSIWKYVPNKSFRYAVLGEDNVLRYYQSRPKRMPDGKYLIGNHYRNNDWLYLKDCGIDLCPDYKLGTLVER